MSNDGKPAPVAFLCHGSEDDEFAERIATDLTVAGISTFFDDWSISAGDSLRERIDQGLGCCTHFIALLSPTSISKPWVRAEIDAAFVRKIQEKARLIPLRYGLEMAAVPPLLSALHCPRIGQETYEEDLRKLLGDIYQVSRAPALGARPSFARRASGGPRGFSTAAQRIGVLMCERSEYGRDRDPEISVEDLLAETGLSEEDFEVAVDELESRGLVKPVRSIGCPPFGYYAVEAKIRLFREFDPGVKGWNARADAATLLTHYFNSEQQWCNLREVMEELGWNVRRINPALSVLVSNRAVLDAKHTSHPLIISTFTKNSKTRGFLQRLQR